MGHSAIDLKYRFQWTYPIVLSPLNPNVLYATSNYVHRTTNDGQSWDVISPDLTRHDPKTLGPSGGPLTKDQTSVEYYGVIFAFAESPKQKGVLWAGSDDGLVHVSRDNGKTWQNVTPKDMAIYTRVSLIEPSRYNAGTAYVAANRFQLDDMKPYLWKTTDFGKRGRASTRASTPPSSRAPFAKTTSDRASSTSAPSAASGSRTTTARIGSDCSSICRPCRCTISP